MKKLVAKSIIGKEYFFSEEYAFYAPQRSARRIMDTLNANQVGLKPGEVWHIYDYDWYMDTFVEYQINIRKGKLRITSI